jgi:deoxyribodipyrimidine photo-lyase
MVKYQTSIFIFRRDLRLHDNTGLLAALRKSETVIPIFIMTPTQLIDNPYKSDNCVQFMFESLEDLDGQIRKVSDSKLYYFFGETVDVLDEIIAKSKASAVFVNRDYTPYSRKRDKEIAKMCQRSEIEFCSYEDLLLQPVGSVLTGSGTIYTKFTPFFNNARKIPVRDPVVNRYKNYWTGKIKNEYKGNVQEFYQENDSILVNGGRRLALKRLSLIKQFSNYNKTRNDLSGETTHLSAYIKFGCVSIREVYHIFLTKLGRNNDLVKQLYWREFYYNISEAFPHIYSKKGAMREQYDKIPWNKPGKLFKRWKEGRTGFPIIDACMRQMNTSGFMHNRGRLIVSNFLIKIMGISWKEGEKYFATQLVDYDLPNNNGNWQWGAGSGADSQQYNRVFNPWIQSQKFDPDGIYIKRWVPELEDVPAADLHQWDEKHSEYQVEYPEPMLDYKSAKAAVQKMYLAIYD